MSAEHRRKYGSFYTPSPVAEALTRWAVRSCNDTVFDPSYGGCAFFEAALTVLDELECRDPARMIFGADLDPAARNHTEELLRRGAEPSQFADGDFFELNPDSFPEAPFSAVVGNPPFIRYHRIPPASKARAIGKLAEKDWAISGRASYWAYFLLYAVRFVRPGGRLAMLLPSAFLHTDYAEEVRRLLSISFQTVYLLPIRERLFEHTQEEVVAVCAEGAHQVDGEPVVRVGDVEKAEDLPSVLAALQHTTRVFRPRHDAGGWLRALVDPEAIAVYDRIAGSERVVRLRDVATPRIGVVTGNNRYFVLSDTERRDRDLPIGAFKRVVRKLAHLPGLEGTDEEVEKRIEDGDRMLLFDPGLEHQNEPVIAYIREGEADDVHLAQKCQARDPWYRPVHTEVPPAFIHCMTASWPRIVVNRSEATCTNNIVRLDWASADGVDDGDQPHEAWYPLALGILSSVSQLSAEVAGRSYGGGILKVEPSEMSRLVIPLLPLDTAKDLSRPVDTYLRDGKPELATAAVDEALGVLYPEFGSDSIRLVRSARDTLFLRRRQHREDARRIIEAYSRPAEEGEA